MLERVYTWLFKLATCTRCRMFAGTGYQLGMWHGEHFAIRLAAAPSQAFLPIFLCCEALLYCVHRLCTAQHSTRSMDIKLGLCLAISKAQRKLLEPHIQWMMFAIV